MPLFPSRRQFIQATAGASALAGFAAFARSSTRAAENGTTAVPLESDVEPLVRLLEETPRERLLERVAAEIRQGTSYREILAALQLAGVRNIEPRPSVGFKFHSVLVVNSAHLASISGADEHRWLPIFWALDYFKATQADDASNGDWTMEPVYEAAVPPAERAAEMFRDAMDRWDEGPADAAAASLARHLGAHEVFELFARYAGRDFRSIGHKAIFVANAWRTMQCIGWRYSEPILRSLAYALLNHSGEPNPAQSDLTPDRPWRDNQELAGRIRQGWTQGELQTRATTELLQTLRSGSAADACRLAVEQLNAGVDPQSLWDAAFAGAGELMMRQPGIVALHASTTTNALRYLYDTSQDDRTRRLVLLQNLAFLPMFREAMGGRGRVREVQIDQLEPADAAGSPQESVEAIFAEVGRSPETAARHTLAYVQATPDPAAFEERARALIALKSRGSHDYKFSSAVLEDYRLVSPPWRGFHLAASVYQLKGSGAEDNPLVQRTRAALG